MVRSTRILALLFLCISSHCYSYLDLSSCYILPVGKDEEVYAINSRLSFPYASLSSIKLGAHVYGSCTFNKNDYHALHIDLQAGSSIRSGSKYVTCGGYLAVLYSMFLPQEIAIPALIAGLDWRTHAMNREWMGYVHAAAIMWLKDEKQYVSERTKKISSSIGPPGSYSVEYQISQAYDSMEVALGVAHKIVQAEIAATFSVGSTYKHYYMMTPTFSCSIRPIVWCGLDVSFGYYYEEGIKWSVGFVIELGKVDEPLTEKIFSLPIRFFHGYDQLRFSGSEKIVDQTTRDAYIFKDIYDQKDLKDSIPYVTPQVKLLLHNGLILDGMELNLQNKDVRCAGLLEVPVTKTETIYIGEKYQYQVVKGLKIAGSGKLSFENIAIQSNNIGKIFIAKDGSDFDLFSKNNNLEDFTGELISTEGKGIVKFHIDISHSKYKDTRFLLSEGSEVHFSDYTIGIAPENITSNFVSKYDEIVVHSSSSHTVKESIYVKKPLALYINPTSSLIAASGISPMFILLEMGEIKMYGKGTVHPHAILLRASSALYDGLEHHVNLVDINFGASTSIEIFSAISLNCLPGRTLKSFLNQISNKDVVDVADIILLGTVTTEESIVPSVSQVYADAFQYSLPASMTLTIAGSGFSELTIANKNPLFCIEQDNISVTVKNTTLYASNFAQIENVRDYSLDCSEALFSIPINVVTIGTGSFAYQTAISKKIVKTLGDKKSQHGDFLDGPTDLIITGALKNIFPIKINGTCHLLSNHSGVNKENIPVFINKNRTGSLIASGTEELFVIQASAANIMIDNVSLYHDKSGKLLRVVEGLDSFSFDMRKATVLSDIDMSIFSSGTLHFRSNNEDKQYRAVLNKVVTSGKKDYEEALQSSITGILLCTDSKTTSYDSFALQVTKSIDIKGALAGIQLSDKGYKLYCNRSKWGHKLPKVIGTIHCALPDDNMQVSLGWIECKAIHAPFLEIAASSKGKFLIEESDIQIQIYDADHAFTSWNTIKGAIEDLSDNNHTLEIRNNKIHFANIEPVFVKASASKVGGSREYKLNSNLFVVDANHTGTGAGIYIGSTVDPKISFLAIADNKSDMTTNQLHQHTFLSQDNTSHKVKIYGYADANSYISKNPGLFMPSTLVQYIRV